MLLLCMHKQPYSIWLQVCVCYINMGMFTVHCIWLIASLHELTQHGMFLWPVYHWWWSLQFKYWSFYCLCLWGGGIASCICLTCTNSCTICWYVNTSVYLITGLTQPTISPPAFTCSNKDLFLVSIYIDDRCRLLLILFWIIELTHHSDCCMQHKSRAASKGHFHYRFFSFF